MDQPIETATDHAQDAGEEPACSPASLPSVTIKPGWAAWSSALDQVAQRYPRDARGELGLDPKRPVVMSGHQPIVFHNGILAKLIALDEAAKRTNAQAVWIVPDQDAINPGTVRVPIGTGESLRVQAIELLADDAIADGVAVGSAPAAPIQMPTLEEASALEPLAQWLDQYAGMESLAAQFAYATIEHACERLGIEVPTIVFASQLLQTDAMGHSVDAMRADAHDWAVAYNTAVAQYPEAGVRPLAIEGQRIELPLWGCRTGEARVAIDTENIDSFDQEELMPRGLLMSALARALLGELFIHGTGGWIYDKISEQWFSDVLGIGLAPMAMVTATQRLDLGFGADDAIDLDHARWQAHHAPHTPSMVGDDEAQLEKDQLVEQIASHTPKSPEREELYQQLQALLDAYRDRHREAINAYQTRVERGIEMRRQIELGNDRTWAFVFFNDQQLEALDRTTRSMMR